MWAGRLMRFVPHRILRGLKMADVHLAASVHCYDRRKSLKNMKLTLHTAPEVPLEAELISPDKLLGKSENEINKLTLFYGNRKVELGEFFTVEGKANGTFELEGDLSRIKLIGSDMSDGRVTINGDVGTHLGAGMSGGEIVVKGTAGDWVGREMSGGRITIKGDAGHLVGSAVRGSAVGTLLLQRAALELRRGHALAERGVRAAAVLPGGGQQRLGQARPCAGARHHAPRLHPQRQAQCGR